MLNQIKSFVSFVLIISLSAQVCLADSLCPSSLDYMGNQIYLRPSSLSSPNIIYVSADGSSGSSGANFKVGCSKNATKAVLFYPEENAGFLAYTDLQTDLQQGWKNVTVSCSKKEFGQIQRPTENEGIRLNQTEVPFDYRWVSPSGETVFFVPSSEHTRNRIRFRNNAGDLIASANLFSFRNPGLTNYWELHMNNPDTDPLALSFVVVTDDSAAFTCKVESSSEILKYVGLTIGAIASFLLVAGCTYGIVANRQSLRTEIAHAATVVWNFLARVVPGYYRNYNDPRALEMLLLDGNAQ